PDGALNLIPFAALVDEHEHYLVERYTITYLTSGRDLLRLQVPQPNGERPLILADPDFGIKKEHGGRQSDDFSKLFFDPIPITGEAAKAIQNTLRHSVLLTGDKASETYLKAILKQQGTPSILHLATHGFFLPDLAKSVNEPHGGWFGGGLPAAAEP